MQQIAFRVWNRPVDHYICTPMNGFLNFMIKRTRSTILKFVFLAGLTLCWQLPVHGQGLELNEGDTICVVGNEMAVGIVGTGFWETLLQARFGPPRL